MNKKRKKILIIGAGIHGSFLAKYLLKYDCEIFLIDKNSKICQGTSSSTHNRANRGYHYPRSEITMRECIKAYDYFKTNYRKFLVLPKSFYCIENNSRVNFKKYQKVFIKNKLKFDLVNKNKFIKSKYLEGIIKAEEGCFNHLKIVKYLTQILKNKKISQFFNFNVSNVQYQKNLLKLKSSKNDEINIEDIDIIVNTTYESTLNILNCLKIKTKKKYIYQTTEVPVVYSKNKFPGITIMDGPFATIMPYASKRNHYLLYDVENSILEAKKSNSNEFKKKIIRKSNYKKIISKLTKYINFTNSLKYKYSLYGKRPIPVNCKGDDRSTKIQINNVNKIKVFSIFEGKYISAPYEMNILSKKIIKNL